MKDLREIRQFRVYDKQMMKDEVGMVEFSNGNGWKRGQMKEFILKDRIKCGED